MDWSDSLRSNSLDYGYEWSITMRKRQKEYHAAHGNGTSQPADTPGLPTMEVEPLPGALSLKLPKETPADHDWHIYTDGSLQNGVGGWAVVAELLKPFGGMMMTGPRGGPIRNSTTPELRAIEEAVKLLNDQRGLIE